MSIVRIFMNPLDARSRIDYPIETGTQLIDFLQMEYPDGFGAPLRVFVGVEEIDLIDLDYAVKDDEQITMLVMPGATVGAYIAVNWLPVLLNTLIATAIGFIINYIFRPSTPGLGDQAEESPVYSLNPTRNEARLGQPIEVHYGIVSAPPSFASAPYSFFYEGSNDMYVDELLVLGMGTYAIEDIFIGDTPLSAIEPAAFRYWLFAPDMVEGGERGHFQQLGIISDEVTGYAAETESPWPFYENVFTSPEVDGFEFNGDRSEVQSTPASISGDVYPAGQSGTTYLFGRIEGVDSSFDITAGDTVTLSGTVSNNISFVVSSAAVDPTNPAIMTLFQTWNSDTQLQSEVLPPGAMYTVNTEVDNLTAGPYRAQKLGSEVIRIDCDIVFSGGLFRIDGTSGNIKTLSVEMEFTHQMIDEDTGAAIGAPVVVNKTFGPSKTRVALRATVTSGELPHGVYETTVRRVTPVDDDSRKTDLVTWTGLKGYVLMDKTKPAYSTVTLMAVRMKATNGIAQAARNRIRVVSGRHMTAGDSRNPATIIKDIWSKPQYGMGRPLAELDTAKLDAYGAIWATEGPFFNGSFDTRSTGFDALQAVASLTAGRIIQDGGLTSIAVDEVQPVRKALFSSANIVKGSMNIDYTFDVDGDFKGNEIEYRDPSTFDAKYEYYPEQTSLPETHKLFGCTDKVFAQSYAKYLWLVKGRRRKVCRFQTELEGLIPRFNDRIGISHPLPDWGQSGAFVSNIDAVTWVVDQPLDWQPSDNVMVIRAKDGTPSDLLGVTKGTQDNMVVFDAVPPEIHDAQSIDPTNYAFGQVEYVVRDFLVTSISPKGESIVEIEAQVYDAELPQTLVSETPPPLFPALPLGPCVWTPPDTGTPVTAELIWTDTQTFVDGGDGNRGIRHGVLGVDGGVLYWNGNGRRMFYSNDGGGAVTSGGDFPGGANNAAFISRFIYSGNKWHLQISPTEQASADQFMAYTDDYTAYTVGGEIWNGLYAVDTAYIKGNELYYGGRNPSNNYLAIARYSSTLGDNLQPAVDDYGDIQNNTNGGEIFPVTGGWVMTYSASSRGIAHHSDDTMDPVEPRRDISNWGLSNPYWIEGNGTDTVLISDGNGEIMKWYPGVLSSNGPLPLVNIDNSPAQAVYMLGKKSTNWLAASKGGSSGQDRWILRHSVDSDGANFVEGPEVILPSDQTTTGSTLPNVQNIYSGDGANWYGYYVGTDGFLRVIKFRYGVQTGDCAEVS